MTADLKLNDDGLNWITDSIRRREPAEHAKRTAMIEAYVAVNDCRYDAAGNEEEVTAQPLPEDKHKFTPTERITLDYKGRF